MNLLDVLNSAPTWGEGLAAVYNRLNLLDDTEVVRSARDVVTHTMRQACECRSCRRQVERSLRAVARDEVVESLETMPIVTKNLSDRLDYVERALKATALRRDEVVDNLRERMDEVGRRLGLLADRASANKVAATAWLPEEMVGPVERPATPVELRHAEKERWLMPDGGAPIAGREAEWVLQKHPPLHRVTVEDWDARVAKSKELLEVSTFEDFATELAVLCNKWGICPRQSTGVLAPFKGRVEVQVFTPEPDDDPSLRDYRIVDVEE